MNMVFDLTRVDGICWGILENRLEPVRFDQIMKMLPKCIIVLRVLKLAKFLFKVWKMEHFNIQIFFWLNMFVIRAFCYNYVQKLEKYNELLCHCLHILLSLYSENKFGKTH